MQFEFLLLILFFELMALAKVTNLSLEKLAENIRIPCTCGYDHIAFADTMDPNCRAYYTFLLMHDCLMLHCAKGGHLNNVKEMLEADFRQKLMNLRKHTYPPPGYVRPYAVKSMFPTKFCRRDVVNPLKSLRKPSRTKALSREATRRFIAQSLVNPFIKTLLTQPQTQKAIKKQYVNARISIQRIVRRDCSR